MTSNNIRPGTRRLWADKYGWLTQVWVAATDTADGHWNSVLWFQDLRSWGHQELNTRAASRMRKGTDILKAVKAAGLDVKAMVTSLKESLDEGAVAYPDIQKRRDEKEGK